MNPNSFSPHKPSMDSDEKKSNTHKSHISRPSNSSYKSKSPNSSGIYTSKSNKSSNKKHPIVQPSKSSSSSMKSWGDDIFPDYGVNWGSKNKLSWAKHEVNFGSSPKKENTNIESMILLENNTKSEVHTKTEHTRSYQNTSSEGELRSEEESKENRNTSHLDDISEKSEEVRESILKERLNENLEEKQNETTETDVKNNILTRRFFRRIVKRMMFIHTFVKKTYGLIRDRITNEFSTVPFLIFHDLAYSDSPKKSKCNEKSKILKLLENLLEPIDPHSLLYFLWGLCDLLFVLIWLFEIPFEFAFENELIDRKFNFFSIVFSFFGILVNFNTKQLCKGNVEFSHRAIACKYVKANLIIDLIGFFGLLFNTIPQIKKSAIIYAIKIFSLEKLINQIEEHFSFRKNFCQVYRIALWLIRIIFIMHLFSCLYYSSQNNMNDSLLQRINENLEKNNSFYDYFFCLYFVNANINIISGGFPIIPKNSGEIIWILFFNLISLSLIIYLYQSNNFSKKHHKELRTIHKFMKKRSISSQLQRNVNDYLQYCYEKEQKTLGTNAVLCKLSDNLRTLLLIEAYVPILKNIPFFYNNFSEKTLVNLALKIEEKVYHSGEMIPENSPIFQTWFFILKGEVDLYFRNNSSELQVKRLSSGDSFGEFSLLGQGQENFSAKSVDNSRLLSINYEEFLKIIKESQKDYEVFCQIRDEICLYGDYSKLYKHCDFCYDPSHILTKCPRIHYYPSHIKIINTAYFKDKLSRKLFQRRNLRNKQHNALKQQNKLSEIAYRYQSNLSFDLNTNNSRRKSLSSSAPPIQRGRKRNFEEKKESIFNNTNNAMSEVGTFNNTSTSSYTQKKPAPPNTVNNENAFNPMPIFSSSETTSKIGTESLSHKIFSIINENRMLYKNIFTDKSISSELPGFFEHNNERASRSSDFKNIDFNKLTKKKKENTNNINNNYNNNTMHFFDKPPISSFSFEEVKVWPHYFPENNVLNIISGLNNNAKKKSICSMKKKQENSNKSKISSENNNISNNNNNFNKINQKKNSEECLLRKKKSWQKSRTESDRKKSKENLYEKIKTFFLS